MSKDISTIYTKDQNQKAGRRVTEQEKKDQEQIEYLRQWKEKRERKREERKKRKHWLRKLFKLR